jgi:adiponectin receptor
MFRAESSDTIQPESEPHHQRFRRRSKSTVAAPQRCHYPLAISVEALDLSTLSPAQAVASIRLLVLSHLAELEARLAQHASDSVDFGLKEKLRTGRELTKDEIKQWAQVAFNMLESIRDGVHSHLPESCLPAMSVETFKSRLPDVPALTIITHLLDIHLPDLPDLRNLPSFAQHAKSTAIRDVRSHLPDFNFVDLRSKLEDVRSRIHDLEFDKPLYYIPVLWERLETLHAHLLAIEMPHAFGLTLSGPGAKQSDDCDTRSDPGSLLLSEAVKAGEEAICNATVQLAEALKRSFHGTRLIQFVDLPDEWKDCPFIHDGYR